MTYVAHVTSNEQKTDVVTVEPEELTCLGEAEVQNGLLEGINGGQVQELQLKDSGKAKLITTLEGLFSGECPFGSPKFPGKFKGSGGIAVISGAAKWFSLTTLQEQEEKHECFANQKLRTTFQVSVLGKNGAPLETVRT